MTSLNRIGTAAEAATARETGKRAASEQTRSNWRWSKAKAAELNIGRIDDHERAAALLDVAEGLAFEQDLIVEIGASSLRL